MHRDIEEGEGSLAQGKTRLVGAACVVADGGAMAGHVGAQGKVTRGRYLPWKGSVKKRRMQRAHHGKKRGRDRLETLGVARPMMVLRRRFAAHSRTRAEVKRGGSARARGRSSLEADVLGKRSGNHG